MKITVTRDDGAEVDITDGVKALYDLLSSSLDFGSGFLSIEDLIPIRKLGYACDFEFLPYRLDVCKNCGHRREHHNANRDIVCNVGWKLRYTDRATAKYELADVDGKACRCKGMEDK